MTRCGPVMSGVGEFGQWLERQLKFSNMTQGDLAKAVHMKDTIVCRHLRHLWKPKFHYVVTYAWFFGGNPHQLWEMVERDWKE